MTVYGIIGRPLGHSFSKGWFERKFAALGLDDHRYYNFPLDSLDELPAVLAQHPDLAGFNVTIPYKKEIIPLLDGLSDEARAIGAVNCVKVSDGKLYGYNTDAHGFRVGLEKLLGERFPGGRNGRNVPDFADFAGVPDGKNGRNGREKLPEMRENLPDGDPISALVLGTGGAAAAVRHVLAEIKVQILDVSRAKQQSVNELQVQNPGFTDSAKYKICTYAELTPAIMQSHRLIVNTTPLGTWPDVEGKPDIPYDCIGGQHFLYDLVYNPPVTAFLAEGARRGAATICGETMLHAQAEKNWEIWGI